MRRALVAAVLALVSAAPALALDMPARKPGLWQLTMGFEGHGLPGQTIKQCIDAATDKEMNSLGGNMRESCTQRTVQHVGDTVVVDSVCKLGAATTTSHAVVTGDFNSAYTVKVDSKRSGAAMPGMPSGGEMRMTIAAKWLGPCEAGQVPGDMIMGNGMKMNIRAIAAMRAGMRHPGMPSH